MVGKSDFNENPVVSLDLDLDSGLRLRVCQYVKGLDITMVSTDFSSNRSSQEFSFLEASKWSTYRFAYELI